METPQKQKIKYIYPILSPYDLGWFRISGAGLANCMFVATRAYLLSRKYQCKLIAPTWKKFSIGPYLRNEQDKRIYSEIFKPFGTSGILKFLLIIKYKFLHDSSIYPVYDLGDFFTEFNLHAKEVRSYFNAIVQEKAIKNVDADIDNLKKTVAVHIRLGDYISRLRIDLNWYKGLIINIQAQYPSQKFYIFSDGTDNELKTILELPNTERKFYGNAFADIYAISKCKLLIASNSTFSAWGAFLGNVPTIFNKRHFPPIFNGETLEAVIGNNTQMPSEFNYLFAQNQ